MKKFFLKPYIYFLFLVTPFFVNAQIDPAVATGGGSSNLCGGDIDNLSAVFGLLGCILRRSVWPLLISLSVIVFIVGVIKYISGADDSTKRTEGRNFMMYGIVALFVMVSVWGLVQILQNTFGFGQPTFIPQLQQN